MNNLRILQAVSVITRAACQITISGHGIVKIALTICLGTTMNPIAHCADEVEPNNGPSETNTIDFGVAMNGTIVSGVDLADWFTFTAPADGSMRITPITTSPDVPYNPGTLMLYCQVGFGANLSNHIIDYGGTPIEVGGFVEGCSYNIRISQAQPWGASYSITLLFSAINEEQDLEPNDSPGTAIPIGLQAFAEGHLAFDNPCSSYHDIHDHYRIEVTEIGHLDITCFLHQSQFEDHVFAPSMQLYDSNLSQINGDINGPDSLFISMPQILPGTYYIRVSAYQSSLGYSLYTSFFTQELELSNGPFIISTAAAPSNIEAFKICADGSDASTLGYRCANCDLTHVRFRLTSDPALIDNAQFGGVMSAGDYYVDGGQLYAKLTHPDYLNETYLPLRNDTILVLDTVAVDTLLRIPLEVYRAPVLFVHGLAANSGTFQVADLALQSMDYYPSILGISPLTLRADYSGNFSNLRRFHANRKVVPHEIDALFTQVIEAGYSCGRADVVGHSMGGILTRLYSQSSWGGTPYRDDIHKIITLNTPHYGTQAANYWLDNESVLPGILGVISSGFSTTLDLTASTGLLGAIKDLRVNSRPIRQRLNIPQAQQPSIPSAVITTDGFGDPSAMGIAAQLLMGYAIIGQDLYDGDFSDIIVPRGSQSSSLTPAATVYQQWHAGAADNTSVISGLGPLLSAEPNDPLFTQNGFPPAELEYFQSGSEDHQPTLTRSSATDSVTIVAPAPGAAYAPNDIVTIDIQWTANIDHFGMIVTGGGIEPIVIDTQAVSPLIFQVPGDALGTLSIFLLGGDGSDWIANDESFISVVSSTAPDSIHCDPSGLIVPLGIAHHFDVLGYFAGNPPVNLNGTTDLTIQFDQALLLDQGNRSFQGIALGTDTMVFNYLGVSDTVFVTVVDDPTALVAAFDWTEDLLCQNNSVEFVDQSLGLATGLEWNFPGGTPSSSTDTNPVVTYSSPGVYDVSLVTTFVNGTDTLVLDSLIEVTVIDTALVLDAGTLTANATDATYQWLDCSDGFAPIPNATDSAFTPTTNGLYALSVTQGICTDTSACYLVLTTGIVAHNAIGMVILPNPNNGTFVLQLAEVHENVVIEITDMTGRIIHRAQVQNTRRIPIELDGAVGTYLVNITTSQGRTVLPLVKR